MSGFLEVEIAHFLFKNLPNRITISSIFNQKLNNFTNREIPPVYGLLHFRKLLNGIFNRDRFASVYPASL